MGRRAPLLHLSRRVVGESSASRPLQFLIIGNRDHRRVTGFSQALARRGLPAPIVLDHAAQIEDPSRLAAAVADVDAPLWVRIDSAGEAAEVERALLRLGWEPAAAHPRIERLSPEALATAPVRFGQILAPRQHHLGFCRYLDALEAQLAALLTARPDDRLLNPIADIRELFDKRALLRRYAAAGLPVPDPLPGMDDIEDPEQLRAAMVAARWPAVFVKLTCGSSASCLGLYRFLPGRGSKPRELLLTTVARTPEGRFNSLRLQRLEARADVDAVLGWLLREGAQIERAIPKARLDGRSFDLRVLVIGGEPIFCVVRTSPHPITNLHLGGQRGDLEALRRLIPTSAWDQAMASCVRAFDLHGGLHLGVDLLFEPDWRHRIVEANAFGDLLPRLERDGLDVYGWEIEAALAKR